jgi:F0F1-type ATP synthase assembly protein I
MNAQGSRDEASRPAGRRSVAGRRQQTWASRWNGGRPTAEADSGGAGTEVASYVIAGLLAYGGIGWLVAHFTHIQLFIPIGMLVGMAISLGWVVYKYGRAGDPHE